MKKPQLLTIGLWLVFTTPILILLIYSFAGQWSFPNLYPEHFSFRAIKFIGDNFSNIFYQLMGSLTYSLITVILTILFSILPASILARKDFVGKSLIESLLMSPALLPVMTFSVGVHLIFIYLGLSDNIFGVSLVLAIYSYPYMMRSLIAGFRTIGSDYVNCAKNLGASNLMILWKIEIPLLIPAIIAGGSIVFLISFSNYFLVFLIGGGAVPSFSGYLFPFLNSSDWSIASALTLIFILIPVLLFLLIDLTINRFYKRWI